MPALAAAPDTLTLQRLHHWEKTARERIAFTQPLGGGAVRDYRWGEVVTGDKGSIDARGNLKITGRVKDLFNTSKSKYVAPAPIEDKLVMHTAVEACCVTGANLS